MAQQIGTKIQFEMSNLKIKMHYGNAFSFQGHSCII